MESHLTQLHITVMKKKTAQDQTDIPMEIQVSETIYDLAKEGTLKMILANLDPGADKAIQEGSHPKAVTLKARGTRKKGLTFEVQHCDRVMKGYTIKTPKGAMIQQAIRKTARVIIGDPLPTDHNKLTTENEIPPE